MNVDNNKIRIAFIFSLTILVLGLVLYYLLVIQPIKQEISAKEEALATEEQILASLENSQRMDDDFEEHEVSTLLRHVPVHPWVDQWMLDIERLELVANTQMEEFIFAKDTQLIPSSISSEEESVETGTEENEQSPVETEAENEQNDVSIDISAEAEIPDVVEEEDINRITASLTGQAETYENIYDYIAEVERLERITDVYALYFDAPSEAEVLLEDEEVENTVTFNVFLSTYYAEDFIPEFGEFEQQRPFIAPEHKDTPLYER